MTAPDPRDRNGDGRVSTGEKVFWLARHPASQLWNRHPGVRAGKQLSVGERAADRMRNGMGSWAFVFAALVFLAGWMVANKTFTHFDLYPFILLNLVLSCVAALQGAILLIAAKRSDQVSAELAQHDYETNQRTEALVEANTELTEKVHALSQQVHDLVAELHTQLAPSSPEGTQL